jgi:superfamily I DNA and RNA helicase
LVRVCEGSENMRNIALVEDRLDGSSNFSSWKSRLHITLKEDDDLLSVIQNVLPGTTTNEDKEEWKEDDIKARKIIIYSVRDHLLPRIANLKTTREMYEALKNMF